MDFRPATPDHEAFLEIGVEVRAEPPRQRVWLHVLLFLLTLLTTTAVGARFQFNFEHNRSAWELGSDLNPFRGLRHDPQRILAGIPFSFTLLFILGIHEYGHLAACRRYGIAASYPYFIPAPTMIGTMGAFIRIKSIFRTRRALFDVGIWGPLAGFAATLPLLIVGLAKSRIAAGVHNDGSVVFGSPPLILVLKWFLNPGAGDFDLLLHPVAQAAWVGLFATALNLLPAGQLDGGHILYAISPRWHPVVSRVLATVLGLPMMVMLACWGLAHWLPSMSRAVAPIGDFIDEFYWPGWFMWSVILMILGRRHPPVYDRNLLDPGRRWLAILALAVFLLCFTPIPFQTF